MHQLGLALHQMAAAQVGVAGQNIGQCHLVHHEGVAALAVYHRHHHVTGGALFESGNQLGQVRRAQEGLVGQHHQHRVKVAAQRLQAHAHRALLAQRVVGVVGQGHGEGRYAGFYCVTRKAGDHHHLVHARATQGDELAVDERHALQADQRLGHAAHAAAGARSQEHRAHAQAGVQTAALFE